jgi:hypothetical protein
VANENLYGFEMELQLPVAGLYVVKIQGENQTFTKKAFVK